ncbi:hypothetical protein [Actinoplanes sp. RD1]|uniref:hypothetical protein n=1 Tax=Actinoplanes sp. RD1 TaxID=3064538 RepID=UPI0027421973|nr:hypothetical protein [Actinoplanes sp. RD1]
MTTGTTALSLLLVLLAVPASGRFAAHELPRILAIAATSLAVAAAVTGLVAMLPVRRTTAVRRLAVASGSLVTVAVLVAGAAVVTLLTAAQPVSSVADRSGLSVRIVSGIGQDSQLTAHADLTGVAAGALVRAEISAGDEGSDSTVLAQQVTTARVSGTVSIDLVAAVPDGLSTVRVLAESPEQRCLTSIRPQISETPTVSCKDR